MDFKTKENAVLISGLLVTIILAGLAVGQSNYDTVTLDVNISETTILDVNPNSTSWYGLSIGQTSSDKAFYVENIGSRAIVTIDANITFNATTPYGGATAASFDAGNFIIMNSSNVTGGIFRYINKREWNESKPDFVTPPSGWLPEVSSGTFGKYKTTSGAEGVEYYWFLNKTAAGTDCTDALFRIAKNRHTRSETGDIDFSNSGNYTEWTLTPSGGNGYYDLTSHPSTDINNYCVKVSADCSTVDFFHWNNGLDAATACDNERYVWAGDNLNPGQKVTIYLQARIPFGVAAGTASTGTLSLIALPA